MMRRLFSERLRTTAIAVVVVSAAFTGEADAEKIIRLGHSEGFDTPHGQTMAIFKKHVEDATDGEIRVEMFPNLALGTVVEQMQGVRAGTQEMFISTPAWFSRFYNAIDVLSLPYLVSDWDDANRLLTSPVMPQLAADAEEASGIKLLGTFALGFRNAITVPRPVQTAEDWNGLKIRVQNSPVYITLMQALGANPTPLDPGSIYQALQTGVIDGAETTLPIMFSSRYHEVAPYVSLTKHTYEVFLVYMNKEFFDSTLTPEEQTIVEESMRAAETAGFIIAQAAEESALKSLATGGAQIAQPSGAELDKMRAMAQEVYDELGAQFEPWLSELRTAAAED